MTSMRCLLGFLALAVVEMAGVVLGAEDDGSIEYVSPEIARLEQFVGVWTVTETHYDAQGMIIAEVRGKEEIDWILDRRAIQRVYISGTQPNVYRAIGTLTFNDAEGRYDGVWFDNVSTTGPKAVKGEWTDGTRTMTYALESSDKGGSGTRYRVVDRFLDEKKRVATTYSVTRTGSTKRMEVRYERVSACPGKIRIIYDDALGRRRGE